jgi:hypothetical protein
MLSEEQLAKIKEYEERRITKMKENIHKITLFKGIENEEEWKEKKEEIRRKKNIELEKRALYYKNKENRKRTNKFDDKKIKEIQKKVLETRQRLQQMYDERIARQEKN